MNSNGEVAFWSSVVAVGGTVLRRSLWGAVIAVGGTLLLGGCGGDLGQACPAIAAANFTVTVTDKATGARICDALVEATDSATSEKATLQPSGSGTSCSYSGGFFERPGTFWISASKTGYTTQTKSDVAVTKGVCNVVAAQVMIQL